MLWIFVIVLFICSALRPRQNGLQTLPSNLVWKLSFFHANFTEMCSHHNVWKFFLAHQTICLVILRKSSDILKKIVTHFSLNVNEKFSWQSDNMSDDCEQIIRHFAKSSAMSDGPMFSWTPHHGPPNQRRPVLGQQTKALFAGFFGERHRVWENGVKNYIHYMFMKQHDKHGQMSRRSNHISQQNNNWQTNQLLTRLKAPTWPSFGTKLTRDFFWTTALVQCCLVAMVGK